MDKTLKYINVLNSSKVELWDLEGMEIACTLMENYIPGAKNSIKRLNLHNNHIKNISFL